MTRFIARTALLLACAAAAPLAVHAQATPAAPAASPAAGAHPNISGTWELNVAASKFGPQGAPTKGTLTIVQDGDKITRTQMMSTPMGDMTNTMHHTVGVASTDTIRAQGQAMSFTSTTRWDGATLVIDGKAAMQGMDIPVVARYSLSPDGKQLMIDQVVTTPMGEQSTHIVYDKKG
ncbi:hypothetical protein tb265_08840 [Gemmatimonadetes bacterium T265]|nr:hypothetical protein tb265_08840 [Gemmatimonadetes bacterium T265]